MLKDSYAFSGFSVNDVDQAKVFYGQKLGLTLEETPNMGVTLKLAGNKDVFVYEKADHQPATFTILNFPVVNIDAALDELVVKGVVFEHYDFGGGAKTDDKGIMRGLAAQHGPDIAWFNDPAGNILAILQSA